MLASLQNIRRYIVARPNQPPKFRTLIADLNAYERYPCTPQPDALLIDLLSLSRDIASCRTRQDIQDLIAGPLARYFQFNEIMICLDNADHPTHTNYAYIVKPETTRHPDFARGQKLKYFINDGIHNVIGAAEGPLVMDMDELVEKANRPFYIDFWYSNGMRELIGFPVRLNGQPVGAA